MTCCSLCIPIIHIMPYACMPVCNIIYIIYVYNIVYMCSVHVTHVGALEAKCF